MKTALFLAPALFVAFPAAAQVMTPTEYVTAAGAGDLYERTSSEIVLQTTADPKIREFAQMMIEHHAMSTAEVQAAAAQAGVTAPPPQLNPLQAELVAQLQAEQGPARDAAYIAQQRAAHGQALVVQQAYALDGTAPALKAAASTVVPVVAGHIEQLKAM